MKNQSIYLSSTNFSPVKPKLERLEHVVAIGGGHGLGRVLSSLNHLGPCLTGIVTTTDNGGSTGRLRDTQDCIAWGDLRKCIQQLVTHPTPASLLLEYRFRGPGELTKHNLGNLMLLALDHMATRPLDAINIIRDMLHVKSLIIPMSESPTHLLAVAADQQHIFGEIEVDKMKSMPHALKLDPPVKATAEAIEAINQAQLIIIGPGSFLTSIMPPLLLPELRQAIANSDAKKIFITNLVAEDSPAGILTEQQLLSWSQRMTNLPAPDAVLIHSAKNKDCEPFYFRDIAQDTARCHDRKKLRQAITNLTEQLLRTATIA